MKRAEIVVGGHYLAKISGRIVTVKVLAIREVEGYGRSQYTGKKLMNDKTLFDVLNTVTGRKTTFKSAAKFRGWAKADNTGPSHSRMGTGYYSEAQEQQIMEAVDKMDVEPTSDTLHPHGF